MSFHPLTQLPIEHNICSGLQCLGTYLTTTTSEPVCCTTCYQMNVQSLVIHDSASSPGVSNVLGQQRIYCCFFFRINPNQYTLHSKEWLQCNHSTNINAAFRQLICFQILYVCSKFSVSLLLHNESTTSNHAFHTSGL